MCKECKGLGFTQSETSMFDYGGFENGKGYACDAFAGFLRRPSYRKTAGSFGTLLQ